MVSFIVARPHNHEFEVDPETENCRHPDSGEDAFHSLAAEPQKARDKERDHHGQQEKEI
jgi:hypothetical protein